MRQGIDIPDVNIPRTTSLAGSHVLPARPYEPKMHNFDSVDITKSTLPAHKYDLPNPIVSHLQQITFLQ